MKVQRIRVLLLKSHPGSYHVMGVLGRYSQKVSVSINTTQIITYDLLKKIGPDVLFLSDTAGTPVQLTVDEIDAIKRYVSNNVGKGIIATYAAFWYEESYKGDKVIFNNSALLELFGLKQNAQFRPKASQVTLKSISIEGEWVIGGKNKLVGGYESVQVPTTSWENILGGATVIAIDEKTGGCVTSYHEEFYTAMYINMMPEYSFGNTMGDPFLIVNMIENVYKSARHSLQSLCYLSLKSAHTVKHLLQQQVVMKQLSPAALKTFAEYATSRFKMSKKNKVFLRTLGITELTKPQKKCIGSL
ncbi:hypothetical protein EIN_251230 [Entamoeba invadens IP1]|uniref:Uncharacterized protein n=1 Tax=Entamoeba invadens IP1 TaxID=370355 RepID=A0A0A1UGK8_ENTIV|nr:hypothetical protein EIN_251230 [Entamoeba invadens IP1]ELP94979.1 hypothetical protein EIN_251230 [Entamoeba invadens IP1]|eukprot:XP_004261750.1 hypothetical protein EIN_251230 [Entamoeba invadens IP1]